jgi:hypothetical protein
VRYRQGYKYQLVESYVCDVGILHDQDIASEYIFLGADGIITISAGYAWDGPSGPTFDSSNSMRASLVHDSLYQLMREELLPEKWRDCADMALNRILKEDGMWKVRRWYWLKGVEWFAAKAARAGNTKPVLEAP